MRIRTGAFFEDPIASIAASALGGSGASERDVIGEKVDSGAVLCRLYYTREDGLEEAAEMVEDAFRISSQKPDERELILEVVG